LKERMNIFLAGFGQTYIMRRVVLKKKTQQK